MRYCIPARLFLSRVYCYYSRAVQLMVNCFFQSARILMRSTAAIARDSRACLGQDVAITQALRPRVVRIGSRTLCLLNGRCTF